MFRLKNYFSSLQSFIKIMENIRWLIYNEVIYECWCAEYKSEVSILPISLQVIENRVLRGFAVNNLNKIYLKHVIIVSDIP